MLNLNNKKLVVYELNEVPRKVLRSHNTRYPHSQLSQLVSCSTYADTFVSDAGVLLPWSTWPTLHRGVTNEAHLITDFGQDLSDVDSEFPPIWKILASQGISTGVFGSLNSYPLPLDFANYAFYMPDTFAASDEAYPAIFQKFQKFNLSMVDRSGRVVNKGLPVSELLKFVQSIPLLGIKAKTIGSVAMQLANEIAKPVRKNRRRTTQMELAFDVYEKELWKSKPSYSSFFTNHVASSMHRYWPGAFPEDYQNKHLPPDWHDLFSKEIDFTMAVADYQLGRLRKFVDKNPEYSLIVASSMGQQAVDTSEIIRNQLYAESLEDLLSGLGLDSSDWERRRAMLPRYTFKVQSQKMNSFRDTLAAVEICGKPLDWAEHEHGVFMIKLGQSNVSDSDITVTISGRDINWSTLGLKIVEIDDATGSYAYHIPEGIFIQYDPSDKRKNEISSRIDTTEIAPAILRNFQLETMSYMRS